MLSQTKTLENINMKIYSIDSFKALLILFRDVSKPKGTLILLENSTKKGRPISNTHNGVGHV